MTRGRAGVDSRRGRGETMLRVRVTPRSRRDELIGFREDGLLRIRVTAPPVDHKANDAVVRFLARLLGVPRSRIRIVAGHTHRNKLVAISDMDLDEVKRRISDASRQA